MGTYIVGITGASGSTYALRLMELLLAQGHQVLCTVTAAGKLVLRHELDIDLAGMEEPAAGSYLRGILKAGEAFAYYDVENIAAPIASGSVRADAMVVVPCSMGTLAGIRSGISRNLLERAADVMMKERKKLLIVPREAPYNSIHLENMLALSRDGVTVMPASPGFYAKPQSLQQLVDYFVGRLMDQLGLEHNLISRWKGMPVN